MDINIFPNPATEYFNIQSDKMIQRVTLHDVTGRLVLKKSINFLGNKTSINTDLLPEGIYWLSIYSDEKVATDQLTIIK